MLPPRKVQTIFEVARLLCNVSIDFEIYSMQKVDNVIGYIQGANLLSYATEIIIEIKQFYSGRMA